MPLPTFIKKFKLIFFLGLVAFSTSSQAAINNSDLLDNIIARYANASSAWAVVVTDHASWLFWTLTLISMVWTFGTMALKKSDIGDFFAEFVRFTIFTGFFWWLLINGPHFADTIIASMRKIGGEATGLGGSISPSGIVDIGFAVFFKVLDETSVWSPIDSAAGLIMGGIILVVLALIGINMLLLLTSGWILAYGGIFFLGFGGSRWTSDMAINYFKTVLGLAAQLYAMVLLVGIGKTFLDDYYTHMEAGLSLKEMSVMVIVTVILLVLTNQIPQMISGIITGASLHHGGVASFGAGAAFGAASTAMAMASMGGSMAASGASQALGGLSAAKAAMDTARDNVSTGADIASKFSGGGGDKKDIRNSMAAQAGRIGVDAAYQMAKGGHAAASQALADKVDSIYAKMYDKSQDTIGGKVASAIKDNANNQKKDTGGQGK